MIWKDQICSSSRSFWKLIWSWTDLIALYDRQSSANGLIGETDLVRSFMCKRNHNGPSFFTLLMWLFVEYAQYSRRSFVQNACLYYKWESETIVRCNLKIGMFQWWLREEWYILCCIKPDRHDQCRPGGGCFPSGQANKSLKA